MVRPSLLIVSYHFHPSTEIGARRPTELARYLANRGIQVVVVSAFGGQEVKSESEILPGVIAIPVPQPKRRFVDALVGLNAARWQPETPRHSTNNPVVPFGQKFKSTVWSFLRRAFFGVAYFVDSHKRWGLRASGLAVRAGRKYGCRLVISTHPPPTVLLAGALAARRLQIPHVADYRDPWACQLIPKTLFGRIEPWLLSILEGWVLERAAAITSTGALVIEGLARRYSGIRERAHVIRNGYDGAASNASADTRGRLAILFAGELYLGRDPFPFLRAIERLLTRSDVDPERISVTFLGRTISYGGESLAGWLTGKRAASVVQIVPTQPPSVVAEAIAGSTVLLNLAQNQRFSVPAKTFEHLASGRENLLICEEDSETATVVAGIQGVNRVAPEDRDGLDRVLLDLYTRHVIGSKLTAPAQQEIQRYSRDAANECFCSLIASIAGPEYADLGSNEMHDRSKQFHRCPSRAAHSEYAGEG